MSPDVFRRAGPLEYQDLHAIAALPRPDLRETPWRPVVPRCCGISRRSRRCAASGPGAAPGRFGHADGDDLRADPRGRHPAAPSVRVVRGVGGAVHLRGGRRPGRRRDQADDLPHEPRFAVRALADPRRGEREERRVPRRAARPLRRAAQCRVRPPARARGRARRVRRRGAQDPLQVLARRPARARRGRLGHPHLRAHRHRATTTPRPRSSTPTWACSRPTPR
jgi:hypothetical protein